MIPSSLSSRWRLRRRSVILSFAVALALGIAFYLRLWALDSSSTTSLQDDREALRREFDRANMEAMDESAEWRRKYDGEVVSNRQCQEQLLKEERPLATDYEQANRVKAELAAGASRSEALQKENADLRSQIESLRLGGVESKD